MGSRAHGGSVGVMKYEPGHESGYSYSEYGGIRLLSDEYEIYIDEMGKTWSEGNAGEGYYVVAGIMAHPDRIGDVSDVCRDVLREYMGRRDVPEMKFSNIMKGTGGFTGIEEERTRLAYDILDVIRGEGMPFFAVVVDKVGHDRIHKPDYIDENHFATVGVIEAALGYLVGSSSTMTAFRDECCDPMDSEIISMIRDPATKERNPIYEGILDYKSANSKYRFGIQLADFCSGAVWRAANMSETDCYERIACLQHTFRGPRAAPRFSPPVGDLGLKKRWLLAPMLAIDSPRSGTGGLWQCLQRQTALKYRTFVPYPKGRAGRRGS